MQEARQEQPIAPDFSFITVTYNSAADLTRHWAAPLPDGVEWIVVDNGSSDDSVSIARAQGATVIETGSNRGFGAANNVGLAAARGEIVVFANPDITVDYSTLPRLRDLAMSSGGLVAPQLVNIDGSLQPNGRRAPILLDKVQNRLPGAKRSKERYRIYAADGEVRHVYWVIGAAVAGTRELMTTLHGWDDHFFLYYEDKDICLRAWAFGHPVLLDGSARWVHGWARETARFHLRPWLHEISSMAKFYTRYPEFLIPGGQRARRYSRIDALAGQLWPNASSSPGSDAREVG